MKRTFFLMFLASPIVVVSFTFGQDTFTIPLKKAILPDTGQLTGITNIFFKKPDSLDLSYSKTWKDIEVARVLDNTEFVPINIIRYSDPTDSVRYVFPANGDSSLDNDAAMAFRVLGDISITDIRLQIKHKSGRVSCSVAY